MLFLLIKSISHFQVVMQCCLAEFSRMLLFYKMLKKLTQRQLIEKRRLLKVSFTGVPFAFLNVFLYSVSAPSSPLFKVHPGSQGALLNLFGFLG